MNQIVEPLLQLDILDSRKNFAPGEILDATVSWQFPVPQTKIELRIVWNTTGKGDRDLEVVQTLEINNVGTSGDQKVRVTLPYEPSSFSGMLISLVWAIELISYPDKENERFEIVIGPGGNEIVLGEDDQAGLDKKNNFRKRHNIKDEND